MSNISRSENYSDSLKNAQTAKVCYITNLRNQSRQLTGWGSSYRLHKATGKLNDCYQRRSQVHFNLSELSMGNMVYVTLAGALELQLGGWGVAGDGGRGQYAYS